MNPKRLEFLQEPPCWEKEKAEVWGQQGEERVCNRFPQFQQLTDHLAGQTCAETMTGVKTLPSGVFNAHLFT